MCGDPVLRKEREWLQMAEDQKLQLQRPQDFFPKEEEQEGQNPTMLYTGLSMTSFFGHPTSHGTSFFHILNSPEHKMCSVVLCNYFCLYYPVLDFPTHDLG